MTVSQKPTRRSPKKVPRKLTPIVLIALIIAVLFAVFNPGGKGDIPGKAPAQLPASAGDVIGDVIGLPNATAKPSSLPPADTGSQGAIPPSAGDLTAYVIDVGQGDSILLVSPNGKTMLIDASENKYFDTIDSFLKSKNISRLDVVVATHPHSDHIGAMKNVINNYEIGAFYLPPIEHTTATFEKMLTALKNKKVPVKKAIAGAKVPWDDDVTVNILSPIDGEEYDDLNNWSAMLRVKYGETSIMLTGDAESYAEMLALGKFDAADFKSTVLKLGHHGSSSSTSAEFLGAVAPEYAIASLGSDNKYGHPHRETVALLKKYGIPFYRTDESGTVTATMDGTKATITTEK